MADLRKVLDPDVHESLKAIIQANEDTLWFLKYAKIAVLWHSPNMKKDGKLIYACIKKTDPVLELLTGYNFVLKLSEESWDDLNEDERRALLHHELKHCAVKHNSDGTPIFQDGRAIPYRDDRPCLDDESRRPAFRTVGHDCEIFLSDFGTDLPGIDMVREQAQKTFDFLHVDQ